MANPEHVEMAMKGFLGPLGHWGVMHPGESLDLRGADLRAAYLPGADLSGADLRQAHLSVDLRGANLQRANLSEANFGGANLSHAKLRAANLRGATLESTLLHAADFREADLRGASLRDARLTLTDLRGADLAGTNLTSTMFVSAYLSGTNIANAECRVTTWVDVDLSATLGLETVKYGAPGKVGGHTLSWSKGEIPESFLRGCGLADWEIVAARLYRPNLTREQIDKVLYEVSGLRNGAPIQISPLFISYSHSDSLFVDALERRLNEKGVRFWRDIHDMTSGRLETQITRAISMNPTVVLVLSENSVKSDWVEWEAGQGP